MKPVSRFSMQINNSEKIIYAQVIGQKFWCRLDNKTHCFDLGEIDQNSDQSPNSRTANKKLSSISSSKAAHRIIAPMPGKITKIFVSAGQVVEKAQPLLVMEAMKMEYTLKSELNTTVDKINVQVGAQVPLGQLLIELNPKEQQ